MAKKITYQKQVRRSLPTIGDLGLPPKGAPDPLPAPPSLPTERFTRMEFLPREDKPAAASPAQKREVIFDDEDGDKDDLPGMADFLKAFPGWDFGSRVLKGRQLDIDYDIRITAYNASADSLDKKRKYKISFGTYFIQNNLLYRSVLVGLGPEIPGKNQRVLLALFDNIHMRDYQDNYTITINKAGRMADFSQATIGIKVVEAFNLEKELAKQPGGITYIKCCVKPWKEPIKYDTKNNFQIELLGIEKPDSKPKQ
jgi:hypothetical protein